MMNCAECKNGFPELLFEPENAPTPGLAALQFHAAHCADCAAELASLRATMALLDTWHAPEPSPFFDTRLAALLREERQAPPAGFFERMRATLLFGSNMHLRPMMAGVLAVALLVGGGTYAGISSAMHPNEQQQASAAVGDLQTLDRNAQTIDQMDQLLQDGQDDGGVPSNGSQMNP